MEFSIDSRYKPAVEYALAFYILKFFNSKVLILARNTLADFTVETLSILKLSKIIFSPESILSTLLELLLLFFILKFFKTKFYTFPSKKIEPPYYWDSLLLIYILSIVIVLRDYI